MFKMLSFVMFYVKKKLIKKNLIFFLETQNKRLAMEGKKSQGF